MHAPEISILLPVQNIEPHKDWFLQAIESLEKQSYHNWELVLVDDASTDSTPNIIESLELEHNYMHVVTVPKANTLAHSLNIGARYCKGRYIARHDGDDWSSIDRLGKQIFSMQADKRLAAVGSLGMLYFPDGRVSKLNVPLSWSECKRYAVSNNPFIHGSMLFKRDIFESIGGYEESPEFAWAEDYEIWTRMLKYPMCNLPDRLYHYRINPAGVCATRPEAMAAAVTNIIAKYKTYSHCPKS